MKTCWEYSLEQIHRRPAVELKLKTEIDGMDSSSLAITNAFFNYNHKIIIPIYQSYYAYTILANLAMWVD